MNSSLTALYFDHALICLLFASPMLAIALRLAGLLVGATGAAVTVKRSRQRLARRVHDNITAYGLPHLRHRS